MPCSCHALPSSGLRPHLVFCCTAGSHELPAMCSGSTTEQVLLYGQGICFHRIPSLRCSWDIILLSDKALKFCFRLELPEVILREEKGRKERHKGNHSPALNTRGRGLMQYTQKRIVPYLPKLYKAKKCLRIFLSNPLLKIKKKGLILSL